MNGSWCGKLWLNIQLQVKCWQDSWNSMNQMKSPMIVEVILESLQSSGQIGLSGGSWPLQQVLQWMSQPYWRQQTTLLSVILMCIHMPLLFRYDSPEKVREKKSEKLGVTFDMTRDWWGTSGKSGILVTKTTEDETWRDRWKKRIWFCMPR